MTSVRILLPPPLMPLARMLVTTFMAITWSLIRKYNSNCKIDHGFDSAKNAEYIEISCDASTIEIVCKNESLVINADDYVAHMWGLQKSLTSGAWNNINVYYDEHSQKLVFDTGEFPRGFYKNIQDTLFTKYTRYFFGRGFPMEIYQKEVRLGKTKTWKPSAGFIELNLGRAKVYLYALDRFRRLLRKTYGDRVIHVLLADLGDRGEGLDEAITRIYSPNLDLQCLCQNATTSSPSKNLCVSVKAWLLPPQERLKVDISLWLSYKLILEIIYYVLDGSIELISRWPNLAIVTYKAAKRDPRRDDTRWLTINVISPDEIFASLQGVEATATDLGLRSATFVRGLLDGLECCSELASRGSEEETIAGALASKLIPLIDTVIHGIVDRDLYYQVIRMLESIALKAPNKGLESCRRALKRLAL